MNAKENSISDNGNPQAREINVSLPVPFLFSKSFSFISDIEEQEGSRSRIIGAYFSVPLCTPVYAAKNGTVTFSKNTKGKDGLTIIINSVDGEVGRFEHSYKHLDRVYVYEDDYVTRGRLIGLSGNSGNFDKNALGSFHLEFSVYADHGDKIEYLKPVFTGIE